jgi:hypothetical protein
VGTRYRLLQESDVRQAFEEAAAGKPAVLAITNHDFRNMAPDVSAARELVRRVATDFPGVPFRFSEAVAAMRSALKLPDIAPCELDMNVRRIDDARHVLEVRSTTPTFGPQPWLALKTAAGSYHFDNFDIDRPFHQWRYVFDEETFPLSALSSIGVAANNAIGATTVAVINALTEEISKRHWNVPEAVAPALQ